MNGSVYTGSWKKGLRHGYGQERSAYVPFKEVSSTEELFT